MAGSNTFHKDTDRKDRQTWRIFFLLEQLNNIQSNKIPIKIELFKNILLIALQQIAVEYLWIFHDVSFI